MAQLGCVDELRGQVQLLSLSARTKVTASAVPHARPCEIEQISPRPRPIDIASLCSADLHKLEDLGIAEGFY